MASVLIDLISGDPHIFKEDFLVQADTDALYVELAGDTMTGKLIVQDDVDITGDLDVGGHIAIGNNASNTAVTAFNVDETFDGTVAGAVTAMKGTVNRTGTPIFGTNILSFTLTSTYNEEPTVTKAASNTAFNILAVQSATATMSALYGLRVQLQSDAASGAINQGVAEAVGLDVLFGFWIGGKPTSAFGLRIAAQGASGITNACGIQVAKQVGATNNYGIHINGDGAGADVVLGAGKDVSLRYSSTQTELVNLVGSGVFDVQMDLSLTAQNIVTDTTTGTQFGTATSQKIGFLGSTPIIQQTTTSQTPATFVANTSGIADDTATWNGYTVGDVVAILQAFGFMA